MKHIQTTLFSAVLAGTVFSQIAVAGEDLNGSAQIGNTYVSLGAGGAIIALPDTRSVSTISDNVAPFNLISTFDLSSDFEQEVGTNLDVRFETQNESGNSYVLSGFFQSFNQNNGWQCLTPNLNLACRVTGLVDSSPTVFDGGRVSTVAINHQASREVDHIGIGLAEKQAFDQISSGASILYGIDFRRIEQEISEVARFANGNTYFAYNEDLTTNYFGAFIGIEAPFNYPELNTSTTLFARGGLYYADTEFDGTLSNVRVPSLSLSSDEVAFIGTLGFESKVHFNSNTYLAFEGKAEYYSYVPQMLYNQVDVRSGGVTEQANGQNGTEISDADAFAASAMLKLVFELGS